MDKKFFINNLAFLLFAMLCAAAGWLTIYCLGRYSFIVFTAVTVVVLIYHNRRLSNRVKTLEAEKDGVELKNSKQNHKKGDGL